MRPMRISPSAQDDRLDSLKYTLARYDQCKPRLPFRATAIEEAEAWQTQARAKLWELLGNPPSDAERVPLRPRYGATIVRPCHRRIPVTFATRPELDAFGYLLIPDNLGTDEQRPGVLCLPGHGRGADDLVGLAEDGTERDHHDGYQHDFALQCVEKSYVVLAMDMLGFGRRRDEAARKAAPSHGSCQPAAGAALMLGETMAGWRSWDAACAFDLLESRPEVDPERLALIGISGGGTVGLYTAALDKRVKTAVLSGSFCTFRECIFSRSHCIDNYVPGILRWFEMADLAGLIAPRFLFCESGSQDDIFPESGVRTALSEAKRIYEVFGAAGNLDFDIFEGGHQFHGTKAFERMREWL